MSEANSNTASDESMVGVRFAHSNLRKLDEMVKPNPNEKT